MKVVLELQNQTANVRTITVRHDIVIGRGADCSLRLSSPQVSRRHCIMRVGRSGVTIADLDSSNGTWVNGKRVPSGVRQPLDDLCELAVGPICFRVRLLGQPPLEQGLTEVPGPAEQSPAKPPARSDRVQLDSRRPPAIPIDDANVDSRAEVGQLGLEGLVGRQHGKIIPPNDSVVEYLDNMDFSDEPEDSVDVLEAGIIDAGDSASSGEVTSPDLELIPGGEDDLDFAEVELLEDDAPPAHTMNVEMLDDDDIDPGLKAFLKGL